MTNEKRRMTNGKWSFRTHPKPLPKGEGVGQMLNTSLVRLTLPTRGCRVRNRELIENAKHQMVDQGLYGLWPMIKARACRQNLRARARQLQKIFQMNCIVRSLARYYDQLSTLLQSHIGGAVNQVRAGSRSNRSQGTHRTGDNHHACLWM